MWQLFIVIKAILFRINASVLLTLNYFLLSVFKGSVRCHKPGGYPHHPPLHLTSTGMSQSSDKSCHYYIMSCFYHTERWVIKSQKWSFVFFFIYFTLGNQLLDKTSIFNFNILVTLERKLYISHLTPPPFTQDDLIYGLNINL